MAENLQQTALDINDCVMVDAEVVGPSHYVFVAHSAAALQKGSYVSRVVEYRGGTWTGLAEWMWHAVALAVTASAPLSVAVVGRDGEIGQVIGGTVTEDRIDAKRPVGPFRGIRQIGSNLLAFGMKREVYRSTGGSAWGRMMEGMEPPAGANLTTAELIKQRLGNIGGINALASDPSDELLAFGMKGEIWRRVDNRWEKVDSPTNVILTDAVAVPDGEVYACGQMGVLLSGSGDSWSDVTYSGPAELDFRSMSAFNRTIFVADGHSLRFLSDGELKLVDFGTKQIVPCATVVAGSRRILSVAGQEVWESSDGVKWTSILG